MNFSSISNYLTSSIGSDRNNDFDEGIGESDWGIEEPTFPSSRNTSVSHKHSISSAQPIHLPPSIHFNPAYTNNNTGSLNFPTQRNHGPNKQYHCTTQVELTTYIKKYLSLNNIQGEFWEKCKYDLIVSNLLDNAMILSKNDQALKELSHKLENSPQYGRSREYIKILNNDGTRLTITDKKYGLKLPKIGRGSILQCISMLYITMKRMKEYEEEEEVEAAGAHAYPRKKSFMLAIKIILIISTKLIQQRRIYSLITTAKISHRLEDYLLANYKLNKNFMVNLLRVKEDEIFHQNTTKKDSNANILDHTISVMIYHLFKSVRRLLPYMNGPIFEKYCQVNNVNLSIVLDTTTTTKDGEEGDSTASILTQKLNRFNQIRKFFICQLLTFDEPPSRNFFLSKIWDDFSISGDLDHQGDRLDILYSVINEQSQVANCMDNVFEENEVTEDQDVLGMIKPQKKIQPKEQQEPTMLDDASPNLNLLIDKLSTITTNIRYFQKYNISTSTVTDIDELNEKLFIFHQFGQELSNIQELYRVSLGDLGNKTTGMSNNSTPSSSKRSSIHDNDSNNNNNKDGTFNLKSFHTSASSSSSTTSSSIKKRYSLPASINQKISTTPASSPIQAPKSPRTEKKYKRLSAGLQVGLLTVFEEPNKKENKPVYKATGTRRSITSPGGLNSPISPVIGRNPNEIRTISHDDNYINILPPTSYYNETYNQAALDSLSRKPQNNQNSNNTRIVSGSRYSLNSMNSNVSGISDLIVSTNQTSEPEEQPSSFSKEDLKLKLEESFNRIYNLEQKLKDQEKLQFLHPLSNDVDIINEDINIVKGISESGFIGKLESSLLQRELEREHV